MNKPMIFITRWICFCCFMSLVGLGAAQKPYPDSLYNEDTWQRLPIGVEEPAYFYRKADGGPVSKNRIEPPFWWVGMSHPTLQVLIYDQDIRDFEVSIRRPGVELLSVERSQNPNYLFVNLHIGPGALPGKFPIVLRKGSEEKVYEYELKPRANEPLARQGLDASDLVYLIMPDRFANGDYANDSFDDMNQWGVNREKFHFRHGGDLIGLMQRLDYLQDLGVTAIWLNPVVENDQPYDSYHGYAVTDHYKIDPRIGTNEQYLQLVRLCHERGIKVVMDIIHNHCGDQHWFIRDLPSEDWIHQGEEFLPTLYRAPVLTDPYQAEDDLTRVTDSWFDRHMPDLNHKNPWVANYLIQNHIWWTEYSGHDAYRIDTYAYCDQKFMAEWGRRMQQEFPSFNFFAETWVHGMGVQAQFTQNNHLRDYNTYLPGLTDYQLYYGMSEALAGRQGWTDGVVRIYKTLAQDFLYEDPFRNVIFLDNHDLARFYSQVGGDMNKFKSGLAMLFTTRGIPMLYYGTEILLSGTGGAFGEAGRVNFPGGWKEDKSNKFNPRGRSKEEQQAFDYIKTLANYRKNTPALHKGRLTQFVPENGVYVYFRHDENTTVMVLYNSNDKPVEVPTARFRERMLGFTHAHDIALGSTIEDIGVINLDGFGSRVLELRN
jgi:neopullulanase